MLLNTKPTMLLIVWTDRAPDKINSSPARLPSSADFRTMSLTILPVRTSDFWFICSGVEVNLKGTLLARVKKPWSENKNSKIKVAGNNAIYRYVFFPYQIDKISKIQKGLTKNPLNLPISLKKKTFFWPTPLYYKDFVK